MPLHTVVDSPRECVRHADDVLGNPASHLFQMLAVARSIGVAARIGVFAELAEGSAAAAELAARLQLQVPPLQLVLDVLVGEGLVEYRDRNYALSVRGRRWLHPASQVSVTTFLSQTLDYWDSWANLERVVTGTAEPIAAPAADDDAAWSRRIRASYEIARLIADDVLAAVDLVDSAQSVLDLGGGHGWIAASMCKRNPNLRATVIDSAGAVPIGREIMWETDMDRAVSHEVGDPSSADLGGPHDAVLCLALTTDFAAPESQPQLRRIRQALRPGGLVAIMAVRRVEGSQPSSAAAIELFGLLHRAGVQRTSEELRAALDDTGFNAPVLHLLPAYPDLCLYVAETR
jgi:2-polyprenyl-3-methyl-5-hydroxy-6-metoxy-1,4-benzoquinol methylase